MPGFLINRGSEYASASSSMEYASFLNMLVLWLYQNFGYARVKGGSKYAWIIPEYAWLCVIMPEYAWMSLNIFEYAGICVNMAKSAWMAFVLRFLWSFFLLALF